MAKAMVIEDDHHLASLIKEYFDNLDIDVEIIYNPVTAIRQIKSEKYDIILTDINMMPISGLELITQIRKFNEDISIVAMSGSYINTEDNLDHLKQKLENAGMTVFLQKPFVMSDLRSVLEKCGICPVKN